MSTKDKNNKMNIEDEIKKMFNGKDVFSEKGNASIEKLISFREEFEKLVDESMISSMELAKELMPIAGSMEIPEVDLVKLSYIMSMIDAQTPWPVNMLIIFKLGMAYERKLKV